MNIYNLSPSLSFASGALLAAFFSSVQIPLPVIPFLIIILAFLSYLSGKRNSIKFILSFLLISLSAFLWRMADDGFSSFPKDCGALAIVEVQDFSLGGEELEWLNNPFYTCCKIKELRFSQNDQSPIYSDAKVALVIKNKKLKFSYGDILEISGCLARPSEALFDGDFDQSDFLLSREISFLLYANEIKILGHKDSSTSRFLNMRNKVLSRMCSSLSPDENKKMLAALIFGCRQGIDSSTRQRLLMSGTVHIIAISGIHVAIFALMVLCLLAFLPFRLRYTFLPFIVFAYVYGTGFQPSATRAFLMISIWSFQKAALYPSNSISALLYAATISLFLNPFSILDPGFQYSFIITAFLMGAWRKVSFFISLLNVSDRFNPGRLNQALFQRFTSFILSTLFMCVVAFLSGLQISLFNQNIFNPLSIIVNLLISPFLWLIFCASFVSAIFPLDIFSYILNLLLSFFRIYVEFFSDSAIRLANPPLLLFLCTFSLPLFLLIFSSPGKRFSRILILSIFFSITLCFFLPKIRGAKTFVLSGDGRPPVLLALRPERDSAYMINMPGRKHSQKIIELLASNGFSFVDKVYCAESLVEFSEGIPHLFSYFNCGTLIFLTNPALSSYAKIASQSAGANLVKVKTMNEKTGRKTQYGRLADSESKIRLSREEEIKIFNSRNGEAIIEINSGEDSVSVPIENHLNFRLVTIDNP